RGTTTHGQHSPGDHDLDLAGVLADVVQVRRGHQPRTMDAEEAGVGPPLLQSGDRDPDEVRASRGVEPAVVALGLDEQDVVAVHQSGDAAELDGDPVVGVRRRRARQPSDGLAESFDADRLEHVVDRAQVERLDRMLGVCGHEDDRRRFLELADHTGQVHAAQAGHRDVQEDDVDLFLAQQPEGLARVRGRQHPTDPVVAVEEVGEFIEVGDLVVDRERGEGGRLGHRGLTPVANLGTRTVTFVPASGAVSTTSPYPSPNVERSRSSTLNSPTESREVSPASTRRTCSGSAPTPSSSMVMTASRSRSRPMIVTVPPAGLLARPWRTAFSTSGCRLNTGIVTGSTSGAILSTTFTRSPNRACSRTR